MTWAPFNEWSHHAREQGGVLRMAVEEVERRGNSNKIVNSLHIEIPLRQARERGVRDRVSMAITLECLGSIGKKEEKETEEV